MTAVPELRFRWPWRPYQQRVLDAVDAHLADRKLHIVAAPGSGKTILGLEVFRRLGVPTVVLSPTRTIRNQWIDRLSGYMPEGAPMPPGWTSIDLRAPAHFTSLTYQALHTSLRLDDAAPDDGQETDEAAPSHDELKVAVEALRRAKVGLLIMDEAHHLRQAWWKALNELIDGIGDVVVVSLTATPPYDVVGREWKRYEELCGPIDEEISVPELVKSGTLCPHQDFVWAVSPNEDDAQTVRDYDTRVAELTSSLLENEVLREAIAGHPFITAPQENPEGVFEDPEFAVALLCYLREHDLELPPYLLRMLDCDAADIPSMDLRWWQVLLHRYLFNDSWAPSESREAHREDLARRLRATGLLWRRELRINGSRPVRSALSMSPAKRKACVEIYRHERALRGVGLRQVVLTDFIRDREDETHLLGACTVFYDLMNAIEPDERPHLALLTGRLALVHESVVPALQELVSDPGRLVHKPSANYGGYSEVTYGSSTSPLVAPVTELLTRGSLRVLVGTRSLLGEGWDAPVINSLVMASYVGSFMLSNQMRGRAIRRDPEVPDKASSIWHVVAVDPSTPSGFSDWEDLKRRFGTFVGVAVARPVIESGLNRLDITVPMTGGDLDRVNAHAREQSLRIMQLGEEWQQAIAGGELGLVVPSVQTATPPRAGGILFRNTLKMLLISVGQGFLMWWGNFMNNTRTDSLRALFWLLVITAGAALFFTIPKLLRVLYLWLRCLPVDGSLQQMGMALRDGLSTAGLLEMPGPRMMVKVSEFSGGHAINLSGGSFRDKSIFADAMRELLGAIENPRYIITRHGPRFMGTRTDYHPVPALLAARKSRAQGFHRAWCKRLGKSGLIYTRTAEGRADLLKARARAFSAAFVDPAERVDRWA